MSLRKVSEDLKGSSYWLLLGIENNIFLVFYSQWHM